MKKNSTWQSGFFKLRVSLTLLLFSAGIFLALLGSGLFAAAEEQQAPQENSGIQFGQSYHNDVSPALRDLPAVWPPPAPNEDEEAHEANLNPQLPLPLHVDVPDPVVEPTSPMRFLLPNIPAPILNFDGVPFPGVTCNCAPPDTNGAVGLTQYVQNVNKGYQVFNKTTGASVLGPTAIATIWTGVPGVCLSNTRGDPVVLYDHLANRWLISQFAGTSIPTDECIAISTTSDATGTYNRYAFHLGSNFFDYPHLGVWPDAYYMAMNVFNSAGSAFLGPQAFAFDRAAMIAGAPTAAFVTPGITGGPTEPSFLPSDLDGVLTPPVGTANPFVSFPGGSPAAYKVRLFHADFVTPANTTFNLIGSPVSAGFTLLCPGTARNSCIPQLGTTQNLEGIADRLMFRLAYRKFADGHEAVVGNYTVSAGGVAGVRWFELRAVTTAPAVFQESTYQPDTTYRWMASAAMDQLGDLAIGFSASSATINPQIRYAGRLVNDPINTLAQGEAHLFDGTGSQTSGLDRWGDYSHLSVDPVDDCTFWYTQQYIATNGTFNWRTRIGNFKFATCPAGGATPTPTPTATASPSGTPSATPTATPSATPTPTPSGTPSPSPTPTPCSIVFSENFDGVTAPALPPGWVASNATGPAPLWVTSTTTPDTAPNDAFVDDATIVSDKRLDSPGIAITSPSAVLSFRNNFNTEHDPPPAEVFWDGGVLEVSSPNINLGAFTDIIDPAVGGSFIAGGYTGEIDGTAGNPLAGRMAWSGNSGGYINTVVNLGPNVNGQMIKLRFRMGTDEATGGAGWRVDTITVLQGACGTPTPTPTATPTPSSTRTPTPTPTATPTPSSTRTPTPTPTATPTPSSVDTSPRQRRHLRRHRHQPHLPLQHPTPSPDTRPQLRHPHLHPHPHLLLLLLPHLPQLLHLLPRQRHRPSISPPECEFRPVTMLASAASSSRELLPNMCSCELLDRRCRLVSPMCWLTRCWSCMVQRDLPRSSMITGWTIPCRRL